MTSPDSNEARNGKMNGQFHSPHPDLDRVIHEGEHLSIDPRTPGLRVHRYAIELRPEDIGLKPGAFKLRSHVEVSQKLTPAEQQRTFERTRSEWLEHQNAARNPQHKLKL